MGDNKEMRVCQLCQHRNPMDAEHCERCNAPLPTGATTITVPDRPLPEFAAPRPDIRATHATGSRPGTIALHVVGQTQPIIIRDQNETVLGRRMQGEPPPTVDLTEYHAHLLGVSRRHALIRIVDEGYVIEDLNSNNGTWLNETQLQPNRPQLIKNGDQVRLGQLVLYLYFPTRRARTSDLTQAEKS